MTEAKWLHTIDVDGLLKFVCSLAQHPYAERKLRLLAVAFCRQVGGHHFLPAANHAVETAELLADGQAAETERLEANAAAHRAYQSLWREEAALQFTSLSCMAASMACSAVSHDLEFAVTHTASTWVSNNLESDRNRARRNAANIIRDIFGNPFRPVAADTQWFTSTALSLTIAIYEDRAWDRLPILADALEEAGCNDADILNHCRGQGPHARGCWVADLILGKQDAPTKCQSWVSVRRCGDNID